uniref:Uncharacterized protein n=1 Tax=Anguilla anguilla TaxID=7936 RepID=A0A0E9SIL3_ANGAN
MTRDMIELQHQTDSTSATPKCLMKIQM